MDRKIAIGFILVLCVVVGVGYYLTSKNDKEYIPTQNKSNGAYSKIDEDGSLKLNGDYSTEEERILYYFGQLGIAGGITKIDTASMLNVGLPSLVAEYNPEYYYMITAPTESYIAFYYNGELITNY